MSYKRRIAAAILCACFLFRLTSYAVSHDGLYFVAVENMMAPLTEDTMPFWHDGYLYVSSEVFTGAMRDALGISRAKIGDGVLLYRGEQSLLFREGYPYAQDTQEETYAPGMVWHDGGAYVPASVVARYFNLTYSTVSVKYGHLVWLRNASFKMDDKAFAKAAEFQMNAAYQEYLRSLEPQDEPEEEPEPSPEEEPEALGEWEALTEPESMETDPPSAPTTTQPVTPSAPTTTTPVTPSAPTKTTPSAPATTQPATPSAPTKTTPSAPTTTHPATPSAPTKTTPSAPATTPVTPSAPTKTTPSAPTTTTPVTPAAPTITTPPAPITTTEPAAPSVTATTEPSPPEIGGGQNIYLCLRGDASASALLDALDRHNIRAAVFCDETFLSEQGDLLRRIAATGHPIGLYVASGDSASVLARLETCNELLRRVTMEKTRLAYADGAGETLLRALRDAGYICIRPTLDRSASPLRTTRQAAELLTAVSQQSESVTIWLGGTVNRSGLNAFVNEALEVGDDFPTPHETAFF